LTSRVAGAVVDGATVAVVATMLVTVVAEAESFLSEPQEAAMNPSTAMAEMIDREVLRTTPH
jgi:hypothetical protein